MKLVPNFEQIVNDSRGLWLSGLFGSIIGWNPGYDLPTYKEMFFITLKILLDKDIIRFCEPTDPLGHNIAHWKTDSNTIIRYLRECWPEGISHEDDENLNIYFYEVPAILWSDGTGNYLGS
ncbi:hypothetical protein [Photorhabdus temperata]|uniref:hypothetical protein n=1 Tax=Photorhabdus temperata TaxID=574560 RepID=UPI00038A4972|nr:hypothetical protein [Photorhabdus temperata]EQC00010.1 hypothetical protein B738_13618 [Photorhabdus temperata subsp. temperata M1021]